jgi:hypothetical protein
VPPSAKLEKIRIEQVGRLLATGRACRTSARAIAADGLACGVICLPVVNCTRLTTCAFRGAGVIRVRANDTRRITRLRGDDFDAL